MDFSTLIPLTWMSTSIMRLATLVYIHIRRYFVLEVGFNVDYKR